jgi:small subunit ribosomal protein S17
MSEIENNEEQVEETPAAPESGGESPDEAEASVDEPAGIEEPEAQPAAEPKAAPETDDEPQAEALATEEVEPSAEPAAQVGETTEAEAPADDGEPPAAQPKPKRKRLPRRLRPQKTRPRRAAPTGERKPVVRGPKPERERGRRQERRGVVVSSAMDKTIVVKVDVITSHQKYKKVIRRSVKFHAHDEQNAAKVGDVVRIVETRPISATKRWRLAEVVEEAK